MTGTQNHACLAGMSAAVDNLAELGRDLAQDQQLDRRDALSIAYQGIQDYENGLLRQLLDGLQEMPTFRVWGITAAKRTQERLPTLSITHERLSTSEVAKRLGQRGICVWHGNYYALELTESLGLEPEDMVRIGLLHYNTSQEVERLLNELRGLA